MMSLFLVKDCLLALASFLWGGVYVGATHNGRPLSARQGRVFLATQHQENEDHLQAETHYQGNYCYSQAALSGRKRVATRAIRRSGYPYISRFGLLKTAFTFRRGLMGTTFTVKLYTEDSLKAQQTYEAVSARMDTLNQIMSDYLDGSELNRLSETGGSDRWMRVSGTLFDVLQKAKQIARQSGGRYDPTIGPLAQLWRRAVRQRQFPNARERRKARRAVSWRYIELDSTTLSVRLRKPGMRLDLGGIGQGYALDDAQKVLHRHGIRVFLLDLGGDILAGDPPPMQPAGWRIGGGSGKLSGNVPDLNSPDTEPDVVLLKNAAITMSGDTERHLDLNGHRYSHIMNPRTGLGLRHFVQVTVQAPTGTYADALTKVFSVATPHQRKRLQRRFPQARVWISSQKR